MLHLLNQSFSNQVQIKVKYQSKDKLTEIYGLEYPNHRMIFRRLNKDLERVGWRFVSYPIDVQNKPWGWELEKT